MIAGPTTNSRPAAEPGPALAHPAAEAAAIISPRCRASWLKQQAREGKIPHLKIGGAYHFTDEHIAEILGIFEHRPTPKPSDRPAAAPARARLAPRPAEASLPAGVSQLKPRQPRAMRRLQASA